MKKEVYKRERSCWHTGRLFLLTLLMMIVGGSPTWAQVTESFEDITLVDADTWGRAGKFSNGWVCVGSTGAISNTVLHATDDQYPFYLYSSGNTGEKSLGGIAGSTNNYYLVIPTLITGDVTYYCKGTATTYGYLRFYKVKDNGDDTYTIGSQIGSVISKNSSSGWVAGTASVGDEETMIAIKLNRMAIDDITYTPYVETGCKKPKALTISDISFNSASLSWTAGNEDQTQWQIVYSADADFDKDAATPIDVNTTSYSFTGLSDNTTYYVAVRSYCSADDKSAWTTTSFTTTLAPITSFPWSEDFSSITSGIPAGWDNSEGTTTTESRKWNYYSYGHEGGGLRFDSYNNYTNNTNFLKTPAMNFPAGAAMQLKFWYKNPKGGDFSVYISNDGGATYTTSLATGLTGVSSWTEKVIDIPSEFVNNVVIVFKGTSNYGSGDAYIYLDDVLVKENAAYAWSVSGEDVVNNAIDFGEVKNTSTTKTFTITNEGASALTGISVVSSDASAFAVSETDFDIAAGETKDITVTFVKGVVGNYSETISISQNNIDTPVTLTVTGSYAIPTAAAMNVKIGDETVGETVAFGNVGKATTKIFTIANTGEADLVISSITSNNTTDFAVSPAALTVQGNSSETFTVTFLYDENARDVEKTATITVTPSNEGLNPVTFAVTATSIEQWSEDFSGNELPEGWERTSTTYWTFADGVAKSTYNSSNYYLITPSLTVEEGSSLSFDVCATGTYNTMTIQKQKDNGSWTDVRDISYSNVDYVTNVWKTFTITAEDLGGAGNYKLRFNARAYYLDNFVGFKLNANDPKLGIYTDEDCTMPAATSVTKDFSFNTTAPEPAVYYIKNDGTGTMVLSLGENPDGITASLDKTAVAAGEHATLTITMPVEDNKGYHGGNVVVTATDLGTFTVAVSGVIVDENKMNLNFATDNIPATWTTNSWSKNASGYVEVSYSGSPVTMQTSNLTAVAGEDLVVVAKMSYTSSSYSFGVKYKKDGEEEWSDLIPAANIGTSYVMLHGTIAEAGTYQLQFNGQYTQIQRIYGLKEIAVPAMVLDKEDDYSFGLQTAAADYVITVTNEGNADLTDLTAVLANGEESDYTVSVSNATVAPNETATITVTQKFDLGDLGSHSDVLTISSNAGSKTINLSGSTRDGSKLYVDFDNPNSFPAGWQAGANWQVYTSGTDRYAYQSGSTATTIVTTPLTVAENETLTFKVARYASGPSLQIRYSQDGGVTWSDYTTYYTSDEGSSAYTTKTIEGIPAGTTILEFLGKNIKLDAIEGFGIASAPAIALTESGNAVANGSTKAFGTLTSEDGTATYTLSNTGTADLVSTLSKTGDITFDVTATDEGVTKSENTLTFPAGKTATIVVTMPYAEPYGEKSGILTINSEGWVGDMTVNFTATVVDPTAIAVDFADGKRPAGWYVSNNGIGFAFSEGFAKNSSSEQILMSEEMVVSGEEDVLTYEAMASASYSVSYATLTVSYSTDRVNWTPVAEQPTGLTTAGATFQVKGLAAGNYYLQFKGAYVVIDNIIGWHKAMPAPEHDLYLAGSDIPTETVVPGTEYTATVSVASLRTDETVAAELWMQKGDEDAVKVAELTEQTINNGATMAFALTGNVPSAEGTYQTWATVYNANGTVTTDKVEIEVAHTRTLNITDFTRYKADEEADELEADNNNQISPAFDVTVQNTGTTALTPIIKIKQGETVVGTATAAEAIDAEASTTIRVTATNMSAGEGGTLSFTAEAYWSAEENATAFPYATPVEITVVAAAPKFALYQAEEAVTDGDAVAFGLVKEATNKTFTIKNEGNAPLELISIEAPNGYTVTAVTDGNKTIAVNGTLNIDITLLAEQGKVNGDLIFTYKVDALTNKTFTLALSGRSIAADSWTEDFAAEIPASWTSNGWEWNSDRQAAYSTYNAGKTLMTPRLAAENGEELTFDVYFPYSGFQMKVQYSTDKTNWTEVATYSSTASNQTIEGSFIAPVAGNYYLLFGDNNSNSRYAYVDNFVGFKLNIPEHDTEIASSDVPATGTQYADYTATVRLKENLNKAEEVTAKLYVDGEAVATQVETITAKSTTTVTLTWEPQEVIDAAVKAYIEVTYDGGTLTTDEVDLTIAAPYTLDETMGTVVAGTYPALLLNRTFDAGWNTVCLPFEVEETNVETMFGEGTKVYAFNNYTEGNLNFTEATSLSAGVPYIIYVKNDISNPIIVKNANIASFDTTPSSVSKSNATFQGTYAPTADGSLEGKYGVTDEGKIAKGTATTTMKGFRGYLDLPNGANARLVFFDADGTTTSIMAVELDKQNTENIYNLQGQKMNKTQQNGLYIINGKKVVIKK